MEQGLSSLKWVVGAGDSRSTGIEGDSGLDPIGKRSFIWAVDSGTRV